MFTRVGVDRALKFTFELAASRSKKHLTSATKSNGIAISMPYWDERVEAMAAAYPDVRWDKYHIDILAAQYIDQNLVQANHMNADEHMFLRSACRRFGVWYSKPGNGISHPVHPDLLSPRSRPKCSDVRDSCLRREFRETFLAWFASIRSV